jgi:cysteine sulfinate desulfinase/cysteine desulfurase-like protein
VTNDAAVFGSERSAKLFHSLEPSPLALSIGSCNSGIYELTAVLTHMGRSTDAGHYSESSFLFW